MTQWQLPNGSWRHLKAAAKAVLRNRNTSLAAAGILSIGIGMSVAMFSLVDAVLLRPLPFPRQESIQVIWKTDPLTGTSHVALGEQRMQGDYQVHVQSSETHATMISSKWMMSISTIDFQNYPG